MWLKPHASRVLRNHISVILDSGFPPSLEIFQEICYGNLGTSKGNSSFRVIGGAGHFSNAHCLNLHGSVESRKAESL